MQKMVLEILAMFVLSMNSRPCAGEGLSSTGPEACPGRGGRVSRRPVCLRVQVSRCMTTTCPPCGKP